MKVYVGPPLVSCEFNDFDVGVTFEARTSGEKKWFVFSKREVFLRNYLYVKKRRRWCIPQGFDEFLFEVSGARVAALYGKELRMRKLLKKIHDSKVDLVLGYVEMEKYGSHMLLANGWGAAQIVEVPTLLVSHMNKEKAAYSLFEKEGAVGNGIEFLYERYFSFEIVTRGRNFNKDAKWNRGIKGDK